MAQMEWAGRKVLVTGANRGIGRAIVLALAELGAVVLATGRDTVALERVAQEARGQVQTFAVDLAAPAGAASVVDWVAARHGDIGGLINNAALQQELWFPNGATSRAIETEITVNLTAPSQLVAGLLPLLGRHEAPFICNVTSALALTPKASAPVYCATKAGLRSFTCALRYQVRRDMTHLLVNETVMPLVATGMTEGRNVATISPKAAAEALIAGLGKGRDETWIGQTRAFRVIHRAAPGLAARILRDG
ncbi:SDR family NAD(P)-dependent oxidoreductase [Shimia biformata]|uniref:SDR family NAD(P)-dependent oxidoreductase n=1 Tax=Shimia biformata TaxID=1294299 RepID=UPI00194F119A|nr:SDR family NAD(P)-dependent oxidoreductase [Shimia biformata]